MPILTLLLPLITSVVKDRLKTKSAAISTIPLAIAAAVATGEAPIAPDSLEGLITQILMGLVGIFLLLKKEKTGDKK